MATGKASGDFLFKMVGMTNTPGPAGSVLVQVNFEGTATGFGAVFDTCTFIGGGKDGTFSEVGSAYLDSGELLTGIGQGTYESTGKHRWSTSGIMQISDGRRFANHGEIDLAARTWKGANTEIS
jgi:hypothetical protein